MADMKKLDIDVLDTYKDIDESLVKAKLDEVRAGFNKKIIVLDDDPTGIQTVHDVFVYTDWSIETLRMGFAEQNPMFFILTNSRSFSIQETSKAHQELAKNICQVSKETGQDFVIISRGDSTLRGHYPIETDALRTVVEDNADIQYDGEVICPFFLEGGRLTIDNVHYVKEGQNLVPAGETEFAKDRTFGFGSSHLGDYVKEKTNHTFQAEQCTYITLDELRGIKIDEIVNKLTNVEDFNKIIVNAIGYIDLRVFCIALFKAIQKGKNYLFRTAASFPKVLGDISDIPLLTKNDIIDRNNNNGGVVLIGSHVQKTTLQLKELKTLSGDVEFIEFDAHLVKVEGGLEDEVERIIQLVESNILKGRTAAVYTSRKLIAFDSFDKEEILKASVKISDSVTSIIGKLKVKPRFIIAKGGITSSDVGTKALHVKKAKVMGQVKPGIPVWMTGEESKFPNMPYIIFPGNVGEISTLKEIVENLL